MEKTSPEEEPSEAVEIVLIPASSSPRSIGTRILGNLKWDDERSEIEVDVRETDVVLSISVRPRGSSPLGDVRARFANAASAEKLLGDVNISASPTGSYIASEKLSLMLMAQWLRMRAKPTSDISQRGDKKLIKWRLKRVLSYIDERIAGPLPLGELANAAGLSKMYFAAQFRAATGLRPHEFVLRRRVEFAQDLLQTTRTSIVEIAGSVGFQTQAHFTTIFKRYVGQTPGQWRAAQVIEDDPCLHRRALVS